MFYAKLLKICSGRFNYPIFLLPLLVKAYYLHAWIRLETFVLSPI